MRNKRFNLHIRIPVLQPEPESPEHASCPREFPAQNCWLGSKLTIWPYALTQESSVRVGKLTNWSVVDPWVPVSFKRPQPETVAVLPEINHSCVRDTTQYNLFENRNTRINILLICEGIIPIKNKHKRGRSRLLWQAIFGIW